MHLNDEPFQQIKSGHKTIEGRVFDEKRRHTKVGDDILFINRKTDEEMVCEVTGLSIFSSFEEMFREHNPVLFGFEEGETPESAAIAMRTYYSPDEEKQYGVVGISIVPLA